MTEDISASSGSRPMGQAPAGLDGSRFDPARAERERIVEIHRSAVMETCKMMLGTAMPGGSPHARRKARWMIMGFEMATSALRRAIDDTLPAIAMETREGGDAKRAPSRSDDSAAIAKGQQP